MTQTGGQDGAGAIIQPPERILLIRPSALGDVCRTVPVLASLRRFAPSARIDWLVQDSFADAVRHHPALSGVVEFPRKRFGSLLQVSVMREVWAWLGELRRRRYDWVIDAQGLARSGLFTRWSGAPVRIGPRPAPEFAWLAYNRQVEIDRRMHTVDRMLALLSGIGVPVLPDMRLFAPPAERQAVESDRRLTGPFAVIAPTSRWPGKRWPIERFAELARRLLRGGVGAVVVVGSKSERDQCEHLLSAGAAEPRIIDLVGRTSVGGLMALIERAALVVANDSAAIHMAVGFSRPMVALYGPTDRTRVGPYRRDDAVLQHVLPGERLNHKDESLGRTLMERISVDEAVAAAEAALNR